MNEFTMPAVPLIVPGGLFVLGELYAMTLDDVLAPVFGQAFRSPATPETPQLRAYALQHHVPAALATKAAVGQLSAAWVYGCAPPPDVIALMRSPSGKSAALPPFSGCTLRQVSFGPHDVLDLGGVLVTSPLRTALDVARTAPASLATTVIAAMAAQPGLRCSLPRIQQALRAATHVPGKLRGEALLEGMCGEL